MGTWRVNTGPNRRGTPRGKHGAITVIGLITSSTASRQRNIPIEGLFGALNTLSLCSPFAGHSLVASVFFDFAIRAAAQQCTPSILSALWLPFTSFSSPLSASLLVRDRVSAACADRRQQRHRPISTHSLNPLHLRRQQHLRAAQLPVLSLPHLRRSTTRRPKFAASTSADGSFLSRGSLRPFSRT